MKKKARIILLLIIVLAILLSGLIYYLNKVSKVDHDDIKNNGVLNLSGFGVFFEKYSGDFKSSEVASNLQTLTIEYIPKMYNTVKKYKDDKFEEYYNENKNRIKKNIGINDFSEFSTFIDSLRESKIDLDSWYRLDLIQESFNDESDKPGYAYAEYEVSFKNDEKLKFSLYVSKRKSKTPNYIIKLIKN